MEKRQLFGGAITCALPELAIDVSNFRQVPDNQEVFLMEQDTKENDQSIIIELLEPPEGDIKQVLTTHLSDIVDTVGQFDYTKLASAGNEQYLVNYEKLVLGLIRVSQFNVDILVTLNNGNDCALVTKIIETLEISDASLFS